MTPNRFIQKTKGIRFQRYDDVSIFFGGCSGELRLERERVWGGFCFWLGKGFLWGIRNLRNWIPILTTSRPLSPFSYQIQPKKKKEKDFPSLGIRFTQWSHYTHSKTTTIIPFFNQSHALTASFLSRPTCWLVLKKPETLSLSLSFLLLLSFWASLNSWFACFVVLYCIWIVLCHSSSVKVYSFHSWVIFKSVRRRGPTASSWGNIASAALPRHCRPWTLIQGPLGPSLGLQRSEPPMRLCVGFTPLWPPTTRGGRSLNMFRDSLRRALDVRYTIHMHKFLGFVFYQFFHVGIP